MLFACYFTFNQIYILTVQRWTNLVGQIEVDVYFKLKLEREKRLKGVCLINITADFGLVLGEHHTQMGPSFKLKPRITSLQTQQMNVCAERSSTVTFQTQNGSHKEGVFYGGPCF